MSDKTIRRVCFYGGPGTGKSTTSASLFAFMKDRTVGTGYTVELVTEYVKKWAWQEIPVHGFGQVYIFAKQLRSEEIPLAGGANSIITDSPLYLSYLYEKYYESANRGLADNLLGIVRDFDKAYPALHVYLDRGDRPYDPLGRFQDHQVAIRIDKYIQDNLEREYPQSYLSVPFSERNLIQELISEKLGV